MLSPQFSPLSATWTVLPFMLFCSFISLISSLIFGFSDSFPGYILMLSGMASPSNRRACPMIGLVLRQPQLRAVPSRRCLVGTTVSELQSQWQSQEESSTGSFATRRPYRLPRRFSEERHPQLVMWSSVSCFCDNVISFPQSQKQRYLGKR